MPTTAINTGNLTLLDRVRRSNPDGSIAPIVEMLSQKSAILQDAVFKESNTPTGHVITQRTALPSVSWRRYNEGTATSKSKTSQLTETCGMLDGMSKVDCSQAELNGDAGAYRASEDMSFVAAMKNEMETGLIYHSTLTYPERIMGLAPRLTSTTGTAGSQIVLADGSASGADQTSIWLVGWGDKSVYGIYPKGTSGGLQPHDMNIQLARDANNNEYRAYVMNWEWRIGLVVEDWRYLVRVANVDTGNLATTGTVLIDAMIRAVHKLEDTMGVKPVFYCNRTVATYLHLQAKDSVKNSTLSFENVGGKPIVSFLGIPVRVTDAILNTESAIS